MRIDDVIRRGFVVIVCFLIGAAAYFQASGLMSLARATLAEGAPFAAGAPGALGSGQEKLPAGRDRDLSAAAILARNPFDSKTGPLDGSGAGSPLLIGDTPGRCRDRRTRSVRPRSPVLARAPAGAADLSRHLRR